VAAEQATAQHIKEGKGYANVALKKFTRTRPPTR